MTEPWIDSHLIFLMLHILGVALGAGAAFTGDLTFLTSVRNKVITKSEMRVLALTSKIIWIGLLLLLISGIGLVGERPEIFLASQKFWAKMTIVAVIAINGLVFHFIHFPIMTKSIDKKFTASLPLIKKRELLLVSGALSSISWSFVIVLGVLHKTPFGYWQFLTAYFVLITLAISGGLFLKKKIISE